MKRALPLLVLTTTLTAGTVRAEDPVPCEDLARKLTFAMKNATLNAADKAQLVAHRKAGLALCKIEDDAGADIELTAALAILGQ